MSDEQPDSPMTLMLLRLFQKQIVDQCDFVLLAADDLLTSYADDPRPANQRVWFCIQNLLTAAANLSKLLWGGPNKPKLRVQRADLRASVGVDDGSPLNTTAMRNHFEHIDERLDDWDRDSPNHIHVDRVFGPPDAISVPNRRPEIFRGYDPARGTVMFWDEAIDLRAILTEVARIRPIVATEAAKPHWQP